MTTSIAHVHICDKPIIKILYYTVNINSMEAKLFTIRCDINQAISSLEISKIVIVTDLIHVAKKIFDSISYSFQIHATAIFHEL